MRKRKRKAIAKRYALKRKRNKTLRNVKQIINKHWNLLQINSNLRDFSEVKGSYHLKMASGCDNVSETFKLQIFKAISTLRKSRKRPDGKAIQEYMNNSGAGNINESFVLDNLRILVDQNILLNKPTSFGDSHYIVESNCSDKCKFPIDCDTPLNVVQKNKQRDNDKNTNSPCPKNITATQDASTNTCKLVSLENQLRDKQYIIEELFKKNYQSSCNCTVANSNLIKAQKYTKYKENPMIPSSNVNDSVNFVKDNIKNSIDLNSGNSVKEFTITPSSNHINYKNSNTDSSLNVKSDISRDIQENRKIPENKNSGNNAIDLTVISCGSYNDCKSNNTDGNTSNANNDKTPNIQESRKTTENKNRRVFILGDSIVKHINVYDISRQIENCRVYVKGFPGAKTECMEDYAQPTARENPDHILIHVGTNDLPSRRQPDVIAEDIIQLALKLNTNSSDISISNIVTRNDQYKKKASAVNDKLKNLCREKNLHYIDHSNSIDTRHLNGSKLHLNVKGTKILFSNFVEAISNVLL